MSASKVEEAPLMEDLVRCGGSCVFVLNTEVASYRTWDVQLPSSWEAGPSWDSSSSIHRALSQGMLTHTVPEHTQGSQEPPGSL